jgi:hypothetical protein
MSQWAVALNGQQKPPIGRQGLGEGVKVPIDEVIDRQPKPVSQLKAVVAPNEVVTPEA